MIRSSSLVHKRVSDIQPGELLRISFGSSAGIAVFMHHLDNGAAVLGVIQSEDFNRPMTWYAFDDDWVMSYGSDWYIQEDHGPETAAGRKHVVERARLHIDDGGLVMTFAPSEHQSSQRPISFSLGSLEKVELSRHAAPIEKWRIWESEAHFARGAAPLADLTLPA